MSLFFLWFILFSQNPLSQAYGPIYNSKEICLMEVEELFRNIRECTWETAIHRNSGFCRGSLTCDSVDPYIRTHYISLASCTNGRDFCTQVTPACRTNMKKREIDLCNSITPDSHRYGTQ